MKNQNRFGMGARLFALLMCVLLLAGAFPVGAFAAQAQKGSLTVSLQGDTYANLPKTTPVKVTLYQIGEAAPELKAGWRIYNEFSGYGILNAKEESVLGKIAAKIGENIVGKEGFSGTENTLEDGQTCFSNLEQGVYLGVLTGGPEGLEVDPFIVTVPSRDPKTKDMRLNYPVTLKDRCITEATVRKVWDDKENQDGIRPKSLTVSLSSDKPVKLSEKQKSVTLRATNGWTQTVTALPIYYEGEKVNYSWSETDLPKGYQLTNTATDGTITTLTNSHTPETVSATVRKVWSDSGNQDGIRPESLTVKLSNGQTVTLNAANDWKATIDNLPKYEGGKAITYTWTEEGLPEGYELTGDVTNGAITTLTNRHVPEVVSATVTKVWDDADNRDRKRPESLEVWLSNGTKFIRKVTLNAENDWTATIGNLPKNEKGVEIAYTWTEKGLPSGYSLKSSVTDGTITTLTNHHAPATVSATVRKVWDDAGNRDGIRPKSLKVKLSNGQSVTLNAANYWEATIDNLPKYEDGNEIVYTWTEESLPEGYTLTGNVTNGAITTLTNHHTPATVSATVRKVWEDDDNRDGIRPESLTLSLYYNRSVWLSEEQKSVTLSEANNWTATVDNLPKYADGEEILYGWIEKDLPGGYWLSNTAIEGTVTTLTNTHSPERISAMVRKVWDDAEDQDRIRPQSLTVSLSSDKPVTLSEEQKSVTLNAANNWTATVNGLPKYANGEEITYSWVEEGLPEGYKLVENRIIGVLIDGKGEEIPYYTSVEDNLPAGFELVNDRDIHELIEDYGEIKEVGSITQIINAHVPELAICRVSKDWDDFNNSDGVRPDELTVRLVRNNDGETVGSVKLNKSNQWMAELYVDRYFKGEEADYSWVEADLPAGYELVATDVVPIGGMQRYIDANRDIQMLSGTSTTLTNRHTPEMTSRTVRKVWQDENNEDGSRPTRLNVTLWEGFTEVGKAVLNAANNWEATIDGLPKYRDGGKEIEYYWTEEATVGYLLRQPVIDGNVTTLTNVHTPRVKLTEVNGQKVWEDNHNEHNVRPANITILLYADGAPVNAAPVWHSRTGDTWSYTFRGLPAENANGDAIRYTVDEQVVDYYEKEVSGTTITNRLIPRQPQKYTEIKGVKTWEDEEDVGGTRPESVTVHLLRNGEEIASLKVTAETNWTYSFGKQPLDDGYGHEYRYEVREDGVPGYFCRIDGYNLINRLLFRRPTIPGTSTNTPYIPTGRTVQSRNTGTSRPRYENLNASELEETIDLFGYNTPLWGDLLGTGDETPIYPFIFGGVGIVAVIALVFFGGKRKKGSK